MMFYSPDKVFKLITRAP